MLRRTFCAVVGALPFTVFKSRPAVTEGDHDAVMVAVGEASMCWEHPERAGVFDSDRAADIGNRLRQHFADGIGDFATARRRVCDDLRNDEGLLIGYRANIACLIHDRDGLPWEQANQTADAICNLLFETNLPIVRREANKA